MADDVDQAQQLVEDTAQAHIARAKSQASAMPKGKPGDCELCGEWSGRLVKGVCAPCRDKYRLP